VPDELKRRLQAVVGDVYRVENELPGGGMSRLFIATEASLGRKVVIKLLPPELASEVSAQRFQRETSLTADLQHPHILPILSAGSREGILYYVTPYVAGESLRQRLQRDGKLPEQSALRILNEIADALAYAHKRGVVHRDIKPENILLSGDHALLADFGVARALEEAGGGRLTATSTYVGTPGYMAPEQMAGERNADATSDVYALALVAYEMFTGLAPFAGKSGQNLIAAHFTETPPLLTQVSPRVSAAIAKALAKSPEDRFPTAAEFRDAISAPGNSEQRTTRIGRRPMVVASLAAILLIGIGAWRYRVTHDSDVASGRKMLAVLPFENMGPAEDQFFADGVTEELTSRLASLHELGVISRTSSNQYRKTTKSLKQIGQELGVQYVLEGSVRWEKEPKGPGRIRITPQLIRVSDDSHIWADRYDAAASDIFAVQGDVAEKVTRALDVTFGGAEEKQLAVKPTENFDAYAAYLRAQEFAANGFEPAMLDSAVALQSKAISLDPRFALAYAALARVRGNQYFNDQVASRLPAMKAAVDSALHLDPNLPEGHLALGSYYFATFDHKRAAAEFEWVALRRPNDAVVMERLAAIDARRGHYARALARDLKAVEVDPRSLSTALGPTLSYMHLGDYAGAMRFVNRALALQPESLEAQERKAQVQFSMGGDLNAARVTLRATLAHFGLARVASSFLGAFLLSSVPDTTEVAKLDRLSLADFGRSRESYYWWKIVLYDRLGQREKRRIYADSALPEVEKSLKSTPNDASNIASRAWLLAVLGHKAEALSEAERSVELMPTSRDYDWGCTVLEGQVQTLIAADEQEEAISKLKYLLSIPCGVGVPALRVDPSYDALRGNPRFMQLIA
jgi:eukaryotic-like serine/threonine-protein kinase